ncbi:MAG: molybdate ABC transporter substrate-binding protein [Pseudomonadota bacterium]
MKTISSVAILMAAVILVMAGMEPNSFTCSKAMAASELVVFAAASTTNAITEIGELYAAGDMGKIIPSFASSSTLAKQIDSGAPADVFLSANGKWMDFLQERNRIDTGSRIDILGNQIVLIAPADTTLAQVDVRPGFDLAGLLGKDGRLAMGDPDHVPAGIYGKAALSNLGVWEQITNRTAPMKDVRAALVLVERAEAPLGVVYATDAAISKKVRVMGIFPGDSHPAIVYPIAAVAGGNMAEARQFISFLKSPQAVSIFKKYGFDVR